MDAAQLLVDELRTQYQSLANASRAKSMSTYMKDKFVFYGIPSIERKKVFAQWYALLKQDILANAKEIVRMLYLSDQRELQYCAMELLSKIQKKLVSEDIELVEWMIVNKSWWDTVDYIAAHFVGHLFKDVVLRDSKTQSWMASGNIWLQRSCILSQLKYKEAVDIPYLFSLIDQTKDSKEFFLQKANGWSLRQLSKYDSKAVKSYLLANANLPRVTTREAEKYL